MEKNKKEIAKRLPNDPEFFFKDILKLPTFEYEGKTLTHWSMQIKIAEHVRDYENTYVKSGHGVGKCLGVDTDVLMFNGKTKKVQDVKNGDLVMGIDSTPREVTGCIQGLGKLYRITYSDKTSYVVNEDHILCLVATNTKGRQKTGDKTNISVKEYLKWGKNKKRTNVGYKTKIRYRNKSLKIDPYLLGTWLGDGDSNRTRITTVDCEILSCWIDESKKRNLTLKKLKGSDISYHMTSGNKAGGKLHKNNLLNDLNYYNLVKNKHIPFRYKVSSAKQRLQLLAGLLDTDGCLLNSSYEITQKNKTLALDILRLAQSVGCHATINKTKKYCFYKGEKREGIYYRIGITRNINQIPCRIPRKKADVKNEQRKNLHFKIAVEQIEDGAYFGFELLGKDRCFVLGDFTVTHNTYDVASIALWWLFCFENSLVLTTAPTERQLKEILWAEIGKQYDPEMLGGKITTLKLEISESWKALGFTARESTDQEKMAARMQGFHGPHVLVIFDEAAGVHPAFWIAKEGALSGSHVRFLAIANPTSPSGDFYEGCLKHKAITISCFDHPNVITGKEIIPGAVTRKWVDARKEEWGEGSPLYASRVLGEFPDEGEDTLIPLSKCMEAIAREPKKLNIIHVKALGIDVARFGSDSTCLYAKHGPNELDKAKYQGKDTNWTTAKAIEMDKKHKFDIILIDDTGIGGAVTDGLVDYKREDGSSPTILPVNNAESPVGFFTSVEFENIKAELFWLLRIDFQNKNIKIECPIFNFIAGCAVLFIGGILFGFLIG